MKTIEFPKTYSDSALGKMRPLYPGRALLHFLLAGIGIRLSIYIFRPLLLEIGLTNYEAFVVSLTVPCAILFALAFRAAQSEGIQPNNKALAARFQMKRPIRRDWFWLFFIFALAIVGSIILSPTQIWVINTWPVLQPPSSFPNLMNPMLQSDDFLGAISEWLGPQAAGNWRLVVLAAIMFIFNILGEELYFRGILFPRQKLVHGRWTWLVHGLMWNLFHLPIYPWYLFSGLPLTLAVSFIAQKTGNTWMTICLHGLLNLSTLVLVILIVAGAA